MAKADASEAILVAAQGAEVDKRESLQVILARLDASKSQTLLSGQWLEEPCQMASDGFTHCRTVKSRQVRRAVHPKPFGPGRSKGNFFQTSGHLPHRDLDSWEQQKAIMPERSWSQSAMTFVRSTMGRSVLSHGDLQDGHPHGAHRRPQGLGDTWSTCAAPSEVSEVLSPVRVGGRAAGRSHSLPHQAEKAPLMATQAPSGCRPMPGGPFAGRQGVHNRSNAQSFLRTKTDAAATSYAYLGPQANGPPLPAIHPLWS